MSAEEQTAISRKEKKALRDAERKKTGKSKKRKLADTADEEENAVPAAREDGDDIEDTAVSAPVKKGTKRKAEDPEHATADQEYATPSEGASRPKKRKKTPKTPRTGGEDAAEGAGEDGEKKAPAKSRFIVFVGNLPYKTTDASLQLHFAKLHPFTLRHRTDPKTKKSKGFAFLEFENYDRMKTCLKLYHHSMFDPEDKAVGGSGKGNGKGGRRINVELTAGGGGKTEGRKEKIKVKNVRLEEQRKRRAEVERKERAEEEKKNGGKEAKSTGGKGKKEEDVGASAAQEDSYGIHPSRLAMMR